MSKLRVHLTTASVSYKIQYGLAQTKKNKPVAKLPVTPFSLNLDEATLSNLQVFFILVSYFDDHTMSVKGEQLSSLSVPTVNAQNLFKEPTGLCLDLHIPLEHLLMMFMDLVQIMRGHKSGLETRIKEVAPHLVDIDGNTCHHIHNIVKKFT